MWVVGVVWTAGLGTNHGNFCSHPEVHKARPRESKESSAQVAFQRCVTTQLFGMCLGPQCPEEARKKYEVHSLNHSFSIAGTPAN